MSGISMKYDIDEIDEMRMLLRAIRDIKSMGPPLLASNGDIYRNGVAYNEKDVRAQVEENLRTLMMNGTTVAELRDSHRAIMTKMQDEENALRDAS